MPEHPNSSEPENIIISEVQLILAEKRTSRAVLRTGIAVLALPLSAVSFLIVTSKYYDIIHVMHLFLPLMILCTINHLRILIRCSTLKTVSPQLLQTSGRTGLSDDCG